MTLLDLGQEGLESQVLEEDSVQFSSVQLLSRVWLFVTPWTAAHQASLSIANSRDVSFSELQEMVMDREAWRAAIHGVAKSWTQLSDWTELISSQLLFLFIIGY